MKKYFFRMAGLALFLSICSVYAIQPGGNGENIVSITDTADTYHISASFDKAKTRKIQKFINKRIRPNGLFTAESDYIDATTILNDKTKFHIKAYQGNLAITLNKKENTKSSCDRIKKMCEGLKTIIEGE